MWWGHGGSGARRVQNPQTAHVKAANAAAINRPGRNFMDTREREAAHHTQNSGCRVTNCDASVVIIRWRGARSGWGQDARGWLNGGCRMKVSGADASQPV